MPHVLTCSVSTSAAPSDVAEADRSRLGVRQVRKESDRDMAKAVSVSWALKVS